MFLILLTALFYEVLIKLGDSWSWSLSGEMLANSNLFSRHVFIGSDDGDGNENGQKSNKFRHV